ncbi:MAG: hypothetical protein JW749_11205 [Sedimentisphaerales bacterium]|nr:hypothetical protein [Sedimentisphaerales bacterium]
MQMHIIPIAYRARTKHCFALRNATIEPARPISQTIKPDASGNATRWQGYIARDGFGITLIRNHISASSPVIGHSHISH